MPAPLEPSRAHTLGIVSAALGFGAAAMCLLMLAVARVMASGSGPFAAHSGSPESFESIASLWAGHAPFGLWAAGLFGVAGLLIARRNPNGRVLAWVAVALGALVFASYFRASLAATPDLMGAMSLESGGEAFIEGAMLASLVVTGAVTFAFPAWLLFELRRPFGAAADSRSRPLAP